MRRDLEIPSKSKLVIALMWQGSVSQEQAIAACQGCFGKISSTSRVFEFSAYTPYYEPEMGAALKKTFIEIQGLYDRDALPELKLRAMRLEDQFMRDGARTLNVDPMLVSVENIVISTSKNFTHRVYLGRGVWGDLALIWRKNRFQPLEWTYPDYTDNVEFFREVRLRLLSELRSREAPGSGMA